jgi:hypothetical protein
MRRFLLVVIVLFAALTPLQVWAGNSDRPTPAPSGTVGPTPGGVGGRIVTPGQGSGQNPADPVWSPPCVGFSMGPIESYVGGGGDLAGPLFAISFYTCASGGTFSAFNCIANCPPGTPVFIPPPPVAGVIDDLNKTALFPLPYFAPPLERGAFAVVGKRIYFSTAPDRYRELIERKSYPGGWYAEATLTPQRLHLTIPKHDTKQCEGPGKNPSTSQGRADNPCYIVVDEPPTSYRGSVAVGIDWRITVRSNIFGVDNRTWELPRIVATDVDIKELQAVAIEPT